MITGFILGLMGSLHCAGMCGPLTLMTPVVGNDPSSIIASRVTYHVGRITTYAFIGVLFGLIGESMVFAGLQRWLSIIVGVLMLIGLFTATAVKTKLMQAPLFIKSLFARFLRSRTFPSIFTLGAINGLLPCGLVYMAATASIAVGDMVGSVFYMALFGLGTLPMLLTISFAGDRISFARFPILQKLVPIGVASVALLLIVRAEPVSIFRPSSKPTCPACSKSPARVGMEHGPILF